jgi:nicotinamide mononucleotide transporter
METERPITRATSGEVLVYLLVLAAGAPVMGWLLGRITDTNVPYWDGATTAGCLVATWIMAYRKIENWWVWIGTNVSYFFLYRYKGLVITQWCQVVFLVTSVAGYRIWIREWREAQVEASLSESSSPSMQVTSVS